MVLFFIFQIFINTLIVYYFDEISKIINLFDIPDNNRKLHKHKVASIGGCLIFFNIILFLIYYLYNFAFYKYHLNYFEFREFIFFLLFTTLFCVTGFFDDKFNLNSNIRLILYFFFISILIFFDNSIIIKNINFSFLPNVIDISYMSVLFTILAFLLFINAFNMFDGINLQSALYSIFIFLVFIYKGIFIELAILILISILFFLYLNFKNKCFLGDNGTLLISFIISYFFIKSTLLYRAFYADEIFLVMLIPGLDLLRLAVLRIWHGKHPFKPDRNHIHHILLNKFGFLKTTIILNIIIVIPYIIPYYFGHFIYFVALSILSYFLLIFKYSTNNS